MSVTSGIAAGGVLRDEPLKAIPGEAPKESSVPHAALAIERQLHAVRVRDNITVVARTAVARIFSKLGLCVEMIRTPVVAFFELLRVIEQRLMYHIIEETWRYISH